MHYVIIERGAEVHSIPGHVRDMHFTSDRPHEISKDCDCRPATIWGSAAEPRPLYEHRDAEGNLQGPEQVIS